MPLSFKPLLACCAASLALAGCSHTYSSQGSDPLAARIVGSGNIVRQEREIPGADRLVIAGPVDVVLTMGDPSLTVEADDNLVDFLTAESAGDTLTISFDNTRSYTTKTGYTAYLSLPSLRRIELPSAGDIELRDWAADSLEVDGSGSGDLSFDGALGQLTALARGSGDLDFSESAIGSVDADANGSGDIALGAVGNLDARVSGSGDIIAGDVGNLVAWNNGSGDLLYASAQNVEIVKNSGSGDIRKR